VRDEELRAEFYKLCLKLGLPLKIDVNGVFFGIILAEKIFELYKEAVNESTNRHSELPRT
jgi:hypothetical protein